jgi:hypothetical protein
VAIAAELGLGRVKRLCEFPNLSSLLSSLELSSMALNIRGLCRQTTSEAARLAILG